MFLYTDKGIISPFPRFTGYTPALAHSQARGVEIHLLHITKIIMHSNIHSGIEKAMLYIMPLNALFIHALQVDHRNALARLNFNHPYLVLV